MKQLNDFGYKFRSQAMFNKSPDEAGGSSGPAISRHQRASSFKRGQTIKQNSSLILGNTD